MLAAALILQGCATTSTDSKVAAARAAGLLEALTDRSGPPSREAGHRLMTLVLSLEPEASVETLSRQTDTLLAAIGRVPAREIGQVYLALGELRRQPNVIVALTNYYQGLPTTAYAKRASLLRVIGELQRADAGAFLTSVVWEPLTAPSTNPTENITPREYEEILRTAAVHGLAYLRAPDGTLLDTSMNELIRILQTHPSRAIRIAAIDAYMWNHGDVPEAAQRLYAALPLELHPFVERPRFHRGMNLEVFNRRISVWRTKWQP